VALGAGPAGILARVVGQALGLTLFGLGIGLALAWSTTRVLRALLFGVTATDAWTLAGTAAFTACVGLLASYVPARRALAIDPAAALRSE
jgi:putative ABC transport system permease protein